MPESGSQLKERPTVRLAEIAKHAGVSKGTASMALSGGSGNIRVAEATRQRVQQIAEQLGYRTNLTARTLAAGRSMSIGLIVPPITAPTEAAKTHALDAAVREAGYLPIILDVHQPPTEAEPQPLLRFLHDLLARQIDGLIIYQTVPLPRVILDEIEQHVSDPRTRESSGLGVLGPAVGEELLELADRGGG